VADALDVVLLLLMLLLLLPPVLLVLFVVAAVVAVAEVPVLVEPKSPNGHAKKASY